MTTASDETKNHIGISMTPSFLETALSVSNVVSIAGVVVVAAATFCVVFFGSRLSAAKDAELQSFQRQAAAEISKAHEGTARALAEAANANERAAGLALKIESESKARAAAELELERLRRQSWPR